MSWKYFEEVNIIMAVPDTKGTWRRYLFFGGQLDKKR
jgi:hypothetical protein